MISTVDLLVLTISDQLLSMLKILFFFFKKQDILTRTSPMVSLSIQYGFPGQGMELYELRIPEKL
jgi:hypothetical protein